MLKALNIPEYLEFLVGIQTVRPHCGLVSLEDPHLCLAFNSESIQ